MADDFGSIDAGQPTFEEQRLHADTRRTASAGLSTTGGYIHLNYGEPILRGQNAMRVYMEMGDDPTAGVLLYLMLNITASVSWNVREFSPAGEDVQHAQFVESCMNDMGATWDDFIGGVMRGMVQFGFSPYEQVYKVRDGHVPSEKGAEPSKYSDGKIGWADFQPIGQDTITRWDFDENNRVLGLWQQAAPTYSQNQILAIRLVNFKRASFRDNPMGESIFRRAFPAWRHKKALENIEGIAIEREMCGLPVAYVPPQILADNATPEAAAMRESLKKIVRDMRTDEQMGVLFPNAFDGATGKELFRLELMNSGGARSIDVSKVIERYEVSIFRTALADFLGLGTQTNSSGSYALHADKTQLFLMGLRSYLKCVQETINRVAIPRLYAVNGIEAKGYAEIYHSPLDQVDIQQLASAIAQLSGVGMISSNPEIEARLLEILGLPAPVDDGAKSTSPLEVNTQAGSDEPAVVREGDGTDAHGNPTETVSGKAAALQKTLKFTEPVDRDKRDAKPRPKPFNRIR